ncbi:hypothetical protein GLW08_21370 [Pontibacillus yanchengensis]|uniref:Uncharacterized protein n=2 Tax=Pontibacillus yanchengensis TaxID=462910 RepID=A0ACC7VMP4_9BACI|nr:hypothetical protein [Pontibacillus yanchengensis]MYL35435.1 hypothetical protein [Pontibacillus yanchengensis]MYL55854.1 hypothetical protein [Pontibacillus yanchengensis]
MGKGTKRKGRIDSWSSKQDELLAEKVIKHVAEGSTQTKAFEEVGNILNRTTAACGYRWNNNLRKIYKEEFIKAKQAKVAATRSTKKPVEYYNLQGLIEFLQDVQENMYRLRTENDNLQSEIKDLNDEIQTYKEIFQKVQQFSAKVDKVS